VAVKYLQVFKNKEIMKSLLRKKDAKKLMLLFLQLQQVWLYYKARDK
jgi:hypothetical protein